MVSDLASPSPKRVRSFIADGAVNDVGSNTGGSADSTDHLTPGLSEASRAPGTGPLVRATETESPCDDFTSPELDLGPSPGK